MSTKDQISSAHASELREQYGRLERRPVRSRTALVVGSSRRNIGRGIASSLRSAGFGEVLEPDMETLNLFSEHDLQTYLDAWRDIGIDTLVMANGATNLAWIEDQERDDIERVIDNSLTASILATSTFVEATLSDPWLKYIVYIGSMAHKSVLNASAPYCAAKAGLAHFARCAGWELTPKGYRVFIVHPSNTEGTPMTEETIEGIRSYRGISRAEAEEYWGAINLMPRWLRPGDIGAAVSWLVSGEADFLSGTGLEMSGGQR